MLLTVHNLPPNIGYGEVKSFIIAQCGLKEVILDNLVNDNNGGKKVTVGLAVEEDAAVLVRRINGLYLQGRQLYVEDIRKKKDIDQPYRQTQNMAGNMAYFQTQNTPASKPFYNPHNPAASKPFYESQNTVGSKPYYETQNTAGSKPYYETQNTAGSKPYYETQSTSGSKPYYQSQNMTANKPYYQIQSSYQNQSGSSTGNNLLSTYQSQINVQQNQLMTSQYPNPMMYSQPNQYGSHVLNQEQVMQLMMPMNYGGMLNTGMNLGGMMYMPQGQNSLTDYTGQAQRSSLSTQYPQIPVQQGQTGAGFGYQTPKGDDWTRNHRISSNTHQENRQRGGDTWARGSGFGQKRSRSRSPRNRRGRSRDRFTYSPKRSRNEDKNYRDSSRNTSNSNRDSQRYRSGRDENYTSKSNNRNGKNNRDYDNEPITSSNSNIQPKPWNASTNDSSHQQRRGNDYSKPIPQAGNSDKEGGSADPLSNYRKHLGNKQNDGKKENPYNLRSKAVPKKKNRMLPQIRRSLAARFQAASQLAKTMVKGSPKIITTKSHLRYLKKSVRARLELLLGESLESDYMEMIHKYRLKFPIWHDREFCQTVVDQIPHEENKTGDWTEADGNDPTVKTEPQSPQVDENEPETSETNPAAGNTQPYGNQGAKKRPVPFPSLIMLEQALRKPDPAQKLPKYPNANKQVYKDQKKLKKLEHQDENIYKLQPHVNKALDEELKAITDIIEDVASKPDTELEKHVCERFITIGMNHVRKVLKLNVTKRYMNICTNLIIRVMVSGKPPKKADVELYLRQQNIVSLKKSSKKTIIYVATCKDFDTYDRLLALGSAPLNSETTLLYKPFQLIGPKLSFRERKEKLAQKLKGLGDNATNIKTEADDDEEPDVDEDDDGAEDVDDDNDEDQEMAIAEEDNEVDQDQGMENCEEDNGENEDQVIVKCEEDNDENGDQGIENCEGDNDENQDQGIENCEGDNGEHQDMTNLEANNAEDEEATNCDRNNEDHGLKNCEGNNDEEGPQGNDYDDFDDADIDDVNEEDLEDY